jgi:hypothetical protein
MGHGSKHIGLDCPQWRIAPWRGGLLRALTGLWTQPSPYRRREVVQGEGEQPSAMRPMKTKARAPRLSLTRFATLIAGSTN